MDGGDAIAVAAHIQGRGNLFKSRVAGPFADAVDGALHLARAGVDGGQRVGHRQAEIVVAVRGEHDALRIDGRNALAHFAEHLAVFLRGGVAHGVGHVDGGGAGFDGDAHHLDQKIAIGAGRVFGRKLDVVGQRARQAHRFAAELERLGAADLQLVFQMQIARRQEDVDAGAVGKLQRAGGHLDVFGLGAGQRRDARLAYGLGDGGDGREVALRGHGKAGLDDVHAQVFKGMGHGELFLRGHAAARGLLAIAQGGVKKDYVV